MASARQRGRHLHDIGPQHSELDFYRLSRVSPRTGAPVAAAVTCGVLAAGLLLVNLGNPTLFSALTGTSVVVVYLAYLLVTALLLVRHKRGEVRDEPDLFSLGRWGLPVNIAAVGYGLAMIVNIAWPRAEVYDLAGTGSWWVLLFPIEFVAAALTIGWL